MATVAPVRLRVVFGDRRLLTKSQRLDGLRRCWFLLRPELSTVSDLAAHLADAFALHRSCPDGLLLSMDGFVLPPFESTDVFMDKDVVWVKKKVVKLKKLLALPAAPTCLQESPIIENGSVLSNQTVARVKYPQKDNPDNNKIWEDESEDQEDEIDTQAPQKEVLSRKRKRGKADKHPETKKKKKKQTDPNITTTEENVHFEPNKKRSRKMSGLSLLGTGKPCDDVEIGILCGSQCDVADRANSTLIDERHDNADNYCGTSCEPHLTSSSKKLPSRSACRKKARRRWRREAANQEIHSEVPSNDAKDVSSGKQAVDQNIDKEEEIVPIIVRPGHIRFESVDEEGNKLQSDGTFVCSSGGHETLRWNGTTNKKKGQKWGREKNLSMTQEDDVCNETTGEKLIIEEGKVENDQINFEILCPLTRLPQEGDVVVYRILELSSSWCPEISPFRVGKVYSFDAISMKIILVQVLEYPIFSDEKIDDDSEQLPDTSLYKDDGSLEIDYSSLIDVRLFKDSDSKNVVMNNNMKVKNKDTAPPSNLELTAVVNMPKQHVLAPSEESSMLGWEQIDQALKEKKAQLEKNHSCGNQTPSNSSRSYKKGLRGSGLGHTLSFLRRTSDNPSCSA